MLLTVVGLVLFVGMLCWASAIEQNDRERLRPKVSTANLPPIRTSGSRPRGPVYVPFTVGNVTVDLQPKATETIHVGVGGRSRLGKSTSVLPLFDLPIGVLCVALDDTAPITGKVASVGGIDWTNDPYRCTRRLDLLSGPPSVVSELIAAGLPKATGDSGQWRRAARARMWRTLDAMDAAGIERDWRGLIAALWARTEDGDADRACRSWASKLEQVQMLMGQSFGRDLELVQAMRTQQKVVCHVNSFMSPEDAPMLGGWLLVHARYVAAAAGVPFVLIVEEANQAATFAAHIGPIAQAAAGRGVPLVAIGQNLSQLPIEVRNNIGVWVFFGLEDDAEQRFAAHKLRLKPEQLYVEAFPGKADQQGRGWCYVRAPGVPTTLVHVQDRTPNRRQLAVSPHPKEVSTNGFHRQAEHEWDALELNGWHAGPKMLPARTEVVEVPAWVGRSDVRWRAFKKMRRDDEPSQLWTPDRGFWQGSPCLRWTGALRDGRPQFKVDGRTGTVYIEVFKWAGGTIPESWELDHLCGVPACCDPDHLEAVTTAENIARRDGRKRALAALRSVA